MKAVVWSKPTCVYCVSAKALLLKKGFEIEEKVVGKEFTKEQLLEAVPDARTVPQIFINDEYVGGFDELKKYMEEKGFLQTEASPPVD